jgi:hypothetical protein
MSASAVGVSPKGEGARRRAVSQSIRARIEALVAPRCANCAGEIHAGAVRSRGSLFCSVECALSSTVPGLYLG